MKNASIITVDRAVRELRSGLPVVLTAGKQSALVSPAEAFPRAASLKKDKALADSQLILSPERSHALGLRKAAHALSTSKPVTGWIDPLEPPTGDLTAAKPAKSPLIAPTLQLLKLAELLPAFWLQPLKARNPETWAAGHNLLIVTARAIKAYPNALTSSVIRTSDATVPLHDIGAVRVIAFRPRNGGLEHLAILIGAPEKSREPVPVRLHSSCLTGDILGSMRCDCGEQLKKALATSAQEGGGVVLYLNQEGRGIGIANKLKAYTLQDRGKDTLDANELLGYAADERNFGIAAHILKQLGITRIRLMTNNPDKIAQMKARGIDVAARMAHIIDPNGINDFYLETKARKAGHLMDE